MHRLPETVLRDDEAAGLRAKGWTYPEIAQSFGVSDYGAFKMVQRALQGKPSGNVEAARKREEEKLDILEERAYEILNKRHLQVAASGKIVTWEGEPVEDDTVALKAVETLLKVSQRRARLLGLDAPTSVKVEAVIYDGDTIEAQVAQLREVLGE